MTIQHAPTAPYELVTHRCLETVVVSGGTSRCLPVVAILFQATRGPRFGQKVCRLCQGADVMWLRLQVVHRVPHELEAVPDVSGTPIGGVARHGQRHL